jgi:hypothetical protein
MIAFEVSVNGTVLGTCEAPISGTLNAMIVYSETNRSPGIVGLIAGAIGSDSLQKGGKLTKILKIGDDVTVRIIEK